MATVRPELPVLVIENDPSDPAARLGDWLRAAGAELALCSPHSGQPLPAGLSGYSALVVLGGDMGAYDDERAPWLPQLRALLAEAVRAELPTLGICLGAQLLAVACGGTVEVGALGPELGLGTVDVAVGDDLLEAGGLPVVQWHFDTVTTLPEEALLLGSSDRYAAQAFRVGDVAWGLQFHVEATLPMVADWAQSDAAAVRTALGREPEDVVAEVAAAESALLDAGERIAHRFARLVTG